MKRIVTVLMIFTIFICLSTVGYAEELKKTSEVYEARYDAVYIDVERTIPLTGDIWPEESIYWEEVVSGHTYAGTLYLENFYVQNNVTWALYTGQLRKINY